MFPRDLRDGASVLALGTLGHRVPTYDLPANYYQNP